MRSPKRIVDVWQNNLGEINKTKTSTFIQVEECAYPIAENKINSLRSNTSFKYPPADDCKSGIQYEKTIKRMFQKTFEPIFVLFEILGIGTCHSMKSTSSIFLTKLGKFYFVLLQIMFVCIFATTLSLFVNAINSPSKENAGYLAMDCFGLGARLIILQRHRQLTAFLEPLINIACLTHIRVDLKILRRWSIFWCVLLVSEEISQCIIYIYESLRINDVQDALVKSLFFGMSMDKPLLTSSLAYLSEVFWVVIYHSVSGIFSIYFGFVCFFVNKNLLQFADMLQKSRPKDFNTILKLYTAITDVISTADDFLTLPIFITFGFLYVTIFLKVYFLVFVLSFYGSKLLTQIIDLIFASVCLLSMCIMASKVRESGERVKSVVHLLERDVPGSTDRISLILKTQSASPCFTIWKCAVLDRNFIIVSVGTLMTYTILIATFDK